MREGWSYKKLGEVCAPKKDIQRANKCFSKDDEIQYIDISSLDNSIQKITGTSLYIFEDAPSRAQQCVKKGDILVSLVRPNLKNIAIVDSCSNNLVASSGFCVLRESLMIDKSYLFYFINSDKTTNYLCSLTAGANYPAIREEDIRGCIIGVPPLATQQQIVSELDLLSHILDQKRQQLKEYDALAESIFYDMFGDPVENPKGWEMKTIGDLCTLKSGDSKANSAPEGKLPYVKVGDMNLPENSQFITCSSRFVDEEFCKKNIFPKGSVIFPKRGESIRTNKKRLTRIEICCDLNLMGVFSKTDSLLPDYLYHFFLKIDFKEIVKESSTIPQLNNGEISPIRIPLPPLDLQHSFATKIESIEHQKQLLRASIKETEMLFQSRMDYWFNS